MGPDEAVLVFVDVELALLFHGGADFVVQLEEAHTVRAGVLVVLGVVSDDVVSNFELVFEVFHEDDVEDVVGDVDVTAVFVVARCHEDLHYHLLVFV